MKKIFSFLFLAALSASAFAETDDKYHWYYDKVEANPTGKGLVYASEEGTDPTEADFQASVEKQFVVYSLPSTSLFVWAKPAAGYQFAGWFPDYDVSMASLLSASESTAISVSTMSESEDDIVEGYGFEPDATYYGVFTKVKVQYVPGQENVGSIDIDKVANDLGDNITITATPSDETIKFDYWTDSKGNKITANPYTATVSDMETYTAHFSGESIITIDFGKAGSKFVAFSSNVGATLGAGIKAYRVAPVAKAFYDDDYHYIEFDESENAWGYWDNVYDDDWNIVSSNFVRYTGQVPEFTSSYKLEEFGYSYYAGDAAILTGEGELSIVLNGDDTPSGFNNYLVPTADGPVDIASLPATDGDSNAMTYYLFNGRDFVKATSGTVPQGQCYLALDATQYPLPDTIAVAPAKVKGDIDGDGKITVADITKLIEIYNQGK